jgi:hypothetical protein
MRKFRIIYEPILTVTTERKRPLGYLGIAERIT